MRNVATLRGPSLPGLHFPNVESGLEPQQTAPTAGEHFDLFLDGGGASRAQLLSALVRRLLHYDVTSRTSGPQS